MSTGRPRDLGKERFWRRMLSRWQGSSLPVGDFCDRHGLSEANFYAWRRVLRQRDAQDVCFIPVEVSADRASALTPADHGVSNLELVLGGGRLVRIGPGFDAATLQRLLALLEEGRA